MASVGTGMEAVGMEIVGMVTVGMVIVGMEGVGMVTCTPQEEPASFIRRLFLLFSLPAVLSRCSL